MTCKKDGCDSEGKWDWHDGQWQDGPFCTDHVIDNLDRRDRLPFRVGEATLAPTPTNDTDPLLVRSAGVVPSGEKFPVIRSKELLREYEEEGEGALEDI